MPNFIFTINEENLYQKKGLQSSFKNYLLRLHAAENIDFMLALQDLDQASSKLTEGGVRVKTKSIFDTYVSKDGPKQVNLESAQFQHLRAAQEAGKLSISDFIEPVGNSVSPLTNIQNMVKKDRLQDFLRSNEYKEFFNARVTKILTAANEANLEGQYSEQLQKIKDMMADDKKNTADKNKELIALMFEWHSKESKKAESEQDPAYLKFLEYCLDEVLEENAKLQEQKDKIKAEKAAELAKAVSGFREKTKALLNHLSKLPENLGKTYGNQKAELSKFIKEQEGMSFSSTDEIENARKRIEEKLISMHRGLGHLRTLSMTDKSQSSDLSSGISEYRAILMTMVKDVRSQHGASTLSVSRHSQGPSLKESATVPTPAQPAKPTLITQPLVSQQDDKGRKKEHP